MAKRKFQIGDVVIINNKVPEESVAAKYIGSKGVVGGFYSNNSKYPYSIEFGDLAEDFATKELDLCPDFKFNRDFNKKFDSLLKE